MKQIFFYTFCFCLATNLVIAQASYPNNENGQYQDMLTPEYYNTSDGGDFRLEVNEFVHFARLIPFQYPFTDSLGNTVSYTLGRGFGDGVGPGGAGSHHPALDYYVGNSSTLVNLYAVCDGYVHVDKTVSRYRHYLSITTEVEDSSGNGIGKMMVLYGHIDLDLDSADNINLEGKYVKKGDLVSKHLYSGTSGGPHLHFEMRYYRSTDSGLEDFYGGEGEEKTVPSSGPWTYGYWNPDNGYGFAHPLNHLEQETVGISDIELLNEFRVYPNPAEDVITVWFKYPGSRKVLTIVDLTGKKVFQQKYEGNRVVDINLNNYKKGIYFLSIGSNGQMLTQKIVKR